ncbi:MULTISPECIES: hypothetical protein [Erythrobacter]|nr:hypothetical protein [Erythrobacter litoralis]MEE4339525.1 hypothetical protein [Erythrobacter sp.]
MVFVEDETIARIAAAFAGQLTSSKILAADYTRKAAISQNRVAAIVARSD